MIDCLRDTLVAYGQLAFSHGQPYLHNLTLQPQLFFMLKTAMSHNIYRLLASYSFLLMLKEGEKLRRSSIYLRVEFCFNADYNMLILCSLS